MKGYAEEIQVLPVSQLTEYPYNSKIHSDDQIEKIAESISSFGFNNPILVDEDFQIIAGHGRLSAAKLLGMDYVPCIVLDHLSRDEKRAYLIADNRLAEIGTDWDWQLLSDELEKIDSADIVITLTGFDETAILDRDDITSVKSKDDLGPRKYCPHCGEYLD